MKFNNKKKLMGTNGELVTTGRIDKPSADSVYVYPESGLEVDLLCHLYQSIQLDKIFCENYEVWLRQYFL